MRDLLDITKALADRNRLRAVVALEGGELCVCQIIELLGLAPSTVSKHMSILRQARLVDTRKDGRWVHYRLADGDAPAAKDARWLHRHLADDPEIARDAQKLKAILKLDPEVLCQGQCKKS
jgi:DNA-binding transcriptional ArsR family regulator